MAHQSIRGDIRSEIELETVVKNFRKFALDAIEASRLYKAIAKDEARSSGSLKKEYQKFSENEEDKIYLLLATHFSESYSTAEANGILSDTPITDRREKEVNWKLAKEVCLEAKVRWTVRTVKH